MKKRRGANRNFRIFIVILTIVVLVFLASYFNALSEIKKNCQAPAPHFDELVSIFEIPLDDAVSPLEYNSQSCVDRIRDYNEDVEAKDCYIKNVQIRDNNPSVITCHCWHKD